MTFTDKLKSIELELTGDPETFKACVRKLFESANNDKERAIITEFVENTLSAGTERLKEDVELLLVKAKLLEIDEIIPYSYIAKNYFKKSKAWLSQRIKGHNVNGKRTRFTKDELKTLNYALQDISRKFGSITIL